MDDGRVFVGTSVFWIIVLGLTCMFGGSCSYDTGFYAGVSSMEKEAEKQGKGNFVVGHDGKMVFVWASQEAERETK